MGFGRAESARLDENAKAELVIFATASDIQASA
jgi:hypothetical protein